MEHYKVDVTLINLGLDEENKVGFVDVSKVLEAEDVPGEALHVPGQSCESAKFYYVRSFNIYC